MADSSLHAPNISTPESFPTAQRPDIKIHSLSHPNEGQTHNGHSHADCPTGQKRHWQCPGIWKSVGNRDSHPSTVDRPVPNVHTEPVTFPSSPAHELRARFPAGFLLRKFYKIQSGTKQKTKSVPSVTSSAKTATHTNRPPHENRNRTGGIPSATLSSDYSSTPAVCAATR